MRRSFGRMAKNPGPQAAYKRDGFAGVWRYCKGHGIKRWLKARNWARRKARQAKDPAGFRKAEAAYARKVKAARKRREHDHGDKFATFDGLPIPHWIAKINQDARASGVWHGSMFSGYRTPEHSTEICEEMCGAPSCPGRCAGATSNHTCPPTHTGKYPEGAEDVTDPEGLEAYCRSHNRPLYGAGYALPADIPHFSRTGR